KDLCAFSENSRILGWYPGRYGLAVRSWFRGQRVPGSKPDSTAYPPDLWALMHVKAYVEGQASSRWCGAEVWKGAPAEVSSSSSDRGAK
ncbi:hypothetical protein AVEN_214963-1, partial [Araneus ventricosus]